MRAIGNRIAGVRVPTELVCGLSLIAAPLLILTGMLIHHPHGIDAASWLESAEGGHARFYLAHLLFLATAVALVPAALGLGDLLAERGEPTLAWLGRILALLGVAGLCALVGMDFFLWQLVADPAVESEVAMSAVERVTQSVAINAPVAVLIAGGPLGLAVLALGLHRTGEAPLWSTLAITLAVPLTFGGLPLGWLAIAGALVATIGMGSLGLRLLLDSTGSLPPSRSTGSPRGYPEPVATEAR